MPTCCVSNCSNTSKKVSRVNGDISFHLFPKDPDLKNKWILASGRKNWFPSKNATICSDHFHSIDFTDTKKSRRLSQFAYPSIDIWRTTENDESSDEASGKSPKHEATNDDSGSVSSSDNKPVQLDINKRLVKQRIRLLAALKLEKMKVKRFREQNRRKDKKIATLHNTIFDLKKKLVKNQEVNADDSAKFIPDT